MTTARALTIARAYLALPTDAYRGGSAGGDPLTVRAYDALRAETLAQYLALVRGGFRFTWYGAGSAHDVGHRPSADVLRDIRAGSLAVFRGGEPHPALGDAVGGALGTLTFNDLFRAVHDVNGHGAAGSGFGPRGEERAYQAHAERYSDVARLALATETRGQYSVFMVSGRFAPQRAGVLPLPLVYGPGPDA